MSKILVIPDIHLKPWMFDDAANLLDEGVADNCVFLGDLIDDWYKQEDKELYTKTFEAAITFFKEHPDALYCIGNHDISYVWEKLETGFSHWCIDICQHYMKLLSSTLGNRFAFVHRVDNILFSHGGVTELFVKRNWGVKRTDEEIINSINLQLFSERGAVCMWNDISPIWYRPDMAFTMWKEYKYLQVTGHTPVKAAYQNGSLVVCDTFSTYSNGDPIGNSKFILVDSDNKGWREI